ncbi:MAG TPA: carbohydrate ABC transporter permease [Spirochaetia bacterium]|nr:carbohydrate ABC transporter permease [Spirochaetia bacterium]
MITLRRGAFYLTLIIVAVVMVFPFYWMLSTSLKGPREVLLYPPTVFPNRLTLENYTQIAVEAAFPQYLMNSVLVVGASTLVAIFTSCIGGYIFAKFRFPGRNFLFVLILATTMIPFQTYMVPLYLMMKDFQLIDTYLAIMAPLFITSFGIFFIRQNTLAIPDELIDAARIDGAGEWYIFKNIIVNLLIAPISAVTIFTSMFGWKFFIWPLIITNSPDKFVLELGLSSLAQKNALDFGVQMAGAVFSIIPILAVFLTLRKRFVRGITMTGLKG